MLGGHAGSVYSVAFSPDGCRLASGSSDETVRLWSVSKGTELKTLLGHDHYVPGVTFHPNGRLVASAGYDDTIRLWIVCEWSDCTHYLFGGEIKNFVFQLMCVKQPLDRQAESDDERTTATLPRLPMAVCFMRCNEVQWAGRIEED